MGCACSRDGSDYEDKLLEAEDLLPYGSFDTRHIWNLHVKLAKKDHSFSSEKWSKLFKEINCKYPERCERFFDSFKSADETYPVRPLTVLAIMKSNGSPHEKCELIFGLFDTDGSKTIDKTVLQDLITMMFELSVDKLPLLCSSMQPDSDIFNYITGLKENKPKTIIEVTKKFLKSSGKSITDAEFQTFMCSEENQSLLTFTGIRKKIQQTGLSKMT
ncbi:hypothetical protein SteCoe_24687 [Stentor coeruleus]|uniref:EF-hand domain-containing protein n=1 Tax=Stentor coeruleus TaxID=5963 RepID=A0A1R2BH22_9CILI|nr:hypothetical protein SteCoe_24687 [Stentor coeruleus]